MPYDSFEYSKGTQVLLSAKCFETYLNQVEGIPCEALSYIWCKNESTEKIRVDGCLFTVTENLFEALSNLRQPGEDRLLWIDSIGIDQSHRAVSKKLQHAELTYTFHCNFEK